MMTKLWEQNAAIILLIIMVRIKTYKLEIAVKRNQLKLYTVSYVHHIIGELSSNAYLYLHQSCVCTLSRHINLCCFNRIIFVRATFPDTMSVSKRRITLQIFFMQNVFIPEGVLLY